MNIRRVEEPEGSPIGLRKYSTKELQEKTNPKNVESKNDLSFNIWEQESNAPI